MNAKQKIVFQKKSYHILYMHDWHYTTLIFLGGFGESEDKLLVWNSKVLKKIKFNPTFENLKSFHLWIFFARLKFIGKVSEYRWLRKGLYMRNHSLLLRAADPVTGFDFLNLSDQDMKKMRIRNQQTRDKNIIISG